MITGAPILRQVTKSATGSIISASVKTKVFEFLSSFNGTWGIFPAGSSSDQQGFGENIGRVVMSTKVGDRTIGDWMGGLGDQNEPSITFDSMIAIGGRRAAQTSDYRIEAGAFRSYNKVMVPEDVRVEITKSGGNDARERFLAWLDENVFATTKYDVVTPEKVYKNMTLESYEILRDTENGGVSLVTASCQFREIREEINLLSQQQVGKIDNPQSANDKPTGVLQRVQAAANAGYEKIVGTVNNAVTGVGNALSSAIG